MKTRLNKTGNNEGQTIYIKILVEYDQEPIEIEGTYISIDDKGYITYSTTDGLKRYAHYKDCYKQIQEEIF
jgi:hypothetical protein